MKIVQTYCKFSITLTEKQWDSLTVLDDNGDERYSVATGSEHPEIKKLYSAGCDELEWDAGFGTIFFFSCDFKDRAKAKAAVKAFFKRITR